jgi:hypothetical protein
MEKRNLEELCKQISTMEKTHHVQILELISKYPAVQLNPKNNGFHFRADLFPPELVEEIQKYVDFVFHQEADLKNLEQQKEGLRRELKKDDAAAEGGGGPFLAAAARRESN